MTLGVDDILARIIALLGQRTDKFTYKTDSHKHTKKRPTCIYKKQYKRCWRLLRGRHIANNGAAGHVRFYRAAKTSEEFKKQIPCSYFWLKRFALLFAGAHSDSICMDSVRVIIYICWHTSLCPCFVFPFWFAFFFVLHVSFGTYAKP